jgi:hypothetical protein
MRGMDRTKIETHRVEQGAVKALPARFPSSIFRVSAAMRR